MDQEQMILEGVLGCLIKCGRNGKGGDVFWQKWQIAFYLHQLVMNINDLIRHVVHDFSKHLLSWSDWPNSKNIFFVFVQTKSLSINCTLGD